MRNMIIFLTLILLLLFGRVVQAQSCTAIFEAALESTDAFCYGTERNQACYGHDRLTIIPHAGGDAIFQTPGDKTAVNYIQTLFLSSLNVEEETWGVGVLRLQADLPDTLPGQNVTMILFGDVTIENAVDPSVELVMTANAGVNVRSRPTTNADNIVASLRSGQEVIANGRLADGLWVRISFLYNEETMISGWVAADFLSGDKAALNVVESNAALHTPMQAFYLRTGIGEGACADIPGSGILIQTPEGERRVNLVINGVEIVLGSTIYVQAVPGDVMRIYALQGLISVRASGVTQWVPPGTVSIITLDENGTASGAPQYPVPYDNAAVSLLNPILGIMPQVIEAPPALAPEQVQAAATEAEQEAAIAGGSVARSGMYSWVLTEFRDAGCTIDMRTEVLLLGHTTEFPIIFASDGSSATIDWFRNPVFAAAAPGVFVWQPEPDALNNAYTYTFTVLSPTRVQYTSEATVYCPGFNRWVGSWISE